MDKNHGLWYDCPMEKTRFIETEGLSKSYGPNTVLRDVTFHVDSGSILGLIGHNGAGKTTLMTILAGLRSYDGGSFSLNGAKISYLPDVPGFFDYLTCGEYLDFLTGALKTPAIRNRNELLALSGLPDNARIGALSRGMRQRLGIAAVLVNDPDVLLLDEPTSALDPAGRSELLAVLTKLRSEGKAIVLSSHILTDMEKICDEAVFLHQGVISRQVRVADLEKKNCWIVQLEKEVNDLPESGPFTVTSSDRRTLTIVFGDDLKESQDAAMRYLISLDAPILSIRNEASDLNGIFREVCGG